MLVLDGEKYDGCGGDERPCEETDFAPEGPAIRFPAATARDLLAGQEGIFLFHVPVVGCVA